MKILFISTMAISQWGGSEELWVKSAMYAIEQGHDVTVSIYDWGSLHPKILELKNKGAKIILRRKVYFGNSIIQRAKAILIKNIFSKKEVINLKKENPDFIIISQGTIYECMTYDFAKLKELTGAKLSIITQANSEYETIPSHFFNIGRDLFNKADKLYFVSNRNRIVAERQFAMHLPNSTVISNPANIDNYEICKWREVDELLMACVGRLDSSVKGLGVLLQILSNDKWKTRKWKLNLFGSGADEFYLKELVKLYNLQSKVIFNGFVNDVKMIWRENHVLLMPSTLEGTPLSLIEAMLCGRTAVVSDVGGNAELVTEKNSGFVAEAPSLLSFSNALERMWENKVELREYGLRAEVELRSKTNLESYKLIIDEFKIS